RPWYLTRVAIIPATASGLHTKCGHTEVREQVATVPVDRRGNGIQLGIPIDQCGVFILLAIAGDDDETTARRAVQAGPHTGIAALLLARDVGVGSACPVEAVIPMLAASTGGRDGVAQQCAEEVVGEQRIAGW